MIKLGFINTSLTSAHSVRGVGFYTKHLLSHLYQYAPEYDIEITQIASPKPGFDLIHYPYFDPFIHTLPIKKLTKTIVTIHDIIPLEFPSQYPQGLKGKYNLELQKLALKSVVSVITDSYYSVNSIHKYLKIPQAKIKLIYLAAAPIYHPILKTKQSKDISHKYHLPGKYVLYVGDVNWNKNLPSLVRACLSQNLPLVMVGKQLSNLEALNILHPEHSHIPELKNLIHSPLIHRLGFVPDEDLVYIYNLATVYCQPSYAEGFGIPVLEAMSCGIPVVCSKTHSLPEVAESAGIYFNPLDEYELANILTSIFNDKKMQKSYSQKSLVRAEKFSWDKSAQYTLQAYRNCL